MERGNLQEGQFNTLAQSGTAHTTLPSVLIGGNGSKPSNRGELSRKAKKKIITQKMILSLIDVAKKKNDIVMEKSLWNTYYCQNKLITYEKRIYSKYCKNRYCTICLGIRKAEMINKYLPVLSSWEDPHFVTLTIRACSAKRLPIMIDGMVRAFGKIKERNKKRHQRGKGIKLIGIKSLECNFNPVTKTYNPHYHIIVPNKEIALQLKTDWLDIWTKKHNEAWCQDIRKISSIESSLIEIIKYGTKIFTEPDLKNKASRKISPKIYVAAMYNILSTMKDHRIFDRFGFNLPQTTIEHETKIASVTDYDIWIYDPSNADWYSEFTGQVFADFQLDPHLQNLLYNNIDTTLQ
ncbi:MAG: protein rep [Bacteroidetes bacterium]|nr:protein rep [Bacteroidota bacterium]MBL6944311.1 protein rep [Bacteroidales bacterium]